ncbi:NAD-P-binding protein [Irpex lacteus]|nr:NAD-P-binding protein [Irpex lacteus]
MSFPESIQAIGINKTGGVEVVEKLTVPFPKQQPDQVLIKVAWGGVNTIERTSGAALPIPSFPQILGNEASGTVVALPTDEAVLNHPIFKARGYKLEAGLLWTTAITQMTESYNVKKGDTILIHTVAGGLGLLFTAYAKLRGATKAEIAKSYGADHVILYTKENTVQRVLEITKGEGVHAVYDGVGKDTFLANFDLIRRKGTLVSVGNASGAPDPISPLKLSPKNLVLVRPSMPNYIVTPEESEHYTKELFKLLTDGVFKIRIPSRYPFTTEGARDAQTELTTPGGKLAGKILIKIADE